VHSTRASEICPDIVSALTDSKDFKLACLTFDGKKLKQENSGDVDMLGFETDETLDDKKLSLQ
jgi:hypothetical protein